MPAPCDLALALVLVRCGGGDCLTLPSMILVGPMIRGTLWQRTIIRR